MALRSSSGVGWNLESETVDLGTNSTPIPTGVCMFCCPIKRVPPFSHSQHTDIFIAPILIKRWHQHVYEHRIPIQYGSVVTATGPITFMSASLKHKCKHHKVKLRTYFVSWKRNGWNNYSKVARWMCHSDCDSIGWYERVCDGRLSRWYAMSPLCLK